MVERSIINYVEDSLSRGLTLDQIKRNLRSAGWTNNDINEAIRIVNSQQNSTSNSGIVGNSQEGPSEGGGSKKIFILIGILVFIAVVFAVWFFIFKDKGEDSLSTCFDLGGYTCSSSETCGGTTLEASDTSYCCSRECTASCAENWNCGGWTACVNHSQSRNCVDANNCGTTINIPSEMQSCGYNNTGLNCSENNVCNLNCINSGGDADCSCAQQDNASVQNITICQSSSSCNGSVIDSNDSQVCCLGSCVVNTCFGGNVCNVSCAGGDPDCSCAAQSNISIRNVTLCLGANYGCNGTKIFSSDPEVCCAGSCIIPACVPDGLCALNCVHGDIDCNCTQQGGTLCEGSSYAACVGGYNHTLMSKEFNGSSMYCCSEDCTFPETPIIS